MNRFSIFDFGFSIEDSSRKRVYRLALCTLLFAFCASTEAQQAAKVHRIGLLIFLSAANMAPFIESFRQRMRELGYIEGKTFTLEIRGGKTEPARIANLAAELVNLKVDAIVAEAGPAVIAAKRATSTIPIVIRVGVDPVRMGVVESLAHPGGNITGVASITVGLVGKRLELLAEVVPGARRIAILTGLSDRARFTATDEYKEVDAAARVLGVKLQELFARDPDAIDDAFLATTRELPRLSL